MRSLRLSGLLGIVIVALILALTMLALEDEAVVGPHDWHRALRPQVPKRLRHAPSMARSPSLALPRKENSYPTISRSWQSMRRSACCKILTS